MDNGLKTILTWENVKNKNSYFSKNLKLGYFRLVFDGFLSQKFDKKWGVKYRYGHNSIFQKMELRLSYFDARWLFWYETMCKISSQSVTWFVFYRPECQIGYKNELVDWLGFFCWNWVICQIKAKYTEKKWFQGIWYFTDQSVKYTPPYPELRNNWSFWLLTKFSLG